MTNEMQLSKAAGLPVASDTTNGNGYSNPPGKPQGFKKLHRILRGRYKMVIGLGIVCAILGGLWGYLGQKPLYQSEGRIEISPTIPSATSSIDEMLPGYSAFLQSQTALIVGPEMIQRALGQPEWTGVDSEKLTDGLIDRFGANLDAEQIAGTNLIRITFNDPDPTIAQAGAMAMCVAYKEFYDSQDPLLLNRKLANLDQQRQFTNTQLQSYQSQLSDLAKKYGTDDLGDFQRTQMQQKAHLDQMLSEAETEYKQAQIAVGQNPLAPAVDGSAPGAKTAPTPLNEDQIASVDPQMRALILDRTNTQRRINKLKGEGLGPANPRVESLESDLSVTSQEIQTYVDTFNRNFQSAGGTGRVGPLSVSANLQADLEAKKTRVQLLTDARDKQDALCRDIGQRMFTIREYTSKIEMLQASLNLVTHNYDELTTQKKLMESQIAIVSVPTKKFQPTIDRRKQFATVGFIGGGLLPALIVVLFGLIDGRFRFSDEANSDLSGVPLLGILPNLPDLLTDPGQAATAAHCVHQIRTILQIGSPSSERCVFAVTSGSPGDGKTSLTLALGLSFAASGSKTLLIDADLVGAGLTARLNVSSEHGVLEAMAARDIAPFLRNTDVNNLSILPVGESLGGYTGTIAPAAVRRLVNEARTQFDVILIDTGPILASIEAAPVAVAADSVVLCVSRGQQRQIVDRAVALLNSIGAKLAGVVFNRAQPYDFARSISRMSSVGVNGANGNGRHNVPIGPVARAVASSVRPAGNKPNKG